MCESIERQKMPVHVASNTQMILFLTYQNVIVSYNIK